MPEPPEETAGPLIYSCCSHCEYTDQETDPCGQHDMSCEHGCNDSELPQEDRTMDQVHDA